MPYIQVHHVGDLALEVREHTHHRRRGGRLAEGQPPVEQLLALLLARDHGHHACALPAAVDVAVDGPRLAAVVREGLRAGDLQVLLLEEKITIMKTVIDIIAKNLKLYNSFCTS